MNRAARAGRKFMPDAIRYAPDGVTRLEHWRGGFQHKSDNMFKAVLGLKLSDITPEPLFPNATADNLWAYPRPDLPRDLPHRIMSFLDQQTAPVDPRAMCKHFVEHPTNPIKLNIYDAMIGRLLKYKSVLRKPALSEEGKKIFFYKATPTSRRNFLKMNAYRLRTGQTPLAAEAIDGPSEETILKYRPDYFETKKKTGKKTKNQDSAEEEA